MADWKDILLDHRSRFLSTSRPLHAREIEDRVAGFVSAPGTVAITGVRRCGKSSLMRRVGRRLAVDIGETALFPVYFDDERFAGLTAERLSELWEAFLEIAAADGAIPSRVFLFLDEVQVVPGWERWVSRMRETVDCGIVMTGSNASVLSSEFSTFLTGRHRQVRLAPLSFGEFLVFRGLAPVTARRGLMPAERAMLRAQFNRYAELGGFPEVVLNEDLSLAQETFRDIVQRDLVARFGIRNVAQYRALALYLASNTGTRLSLRRLKEMCGVRSENCVKSYLDQFRSAYLFPGVRRFSHKVREVELSQAKTYCVDHGMARSVSFRFSGNRGALLENLVFNVLATRHEEVFYLETARGREVDFITRDKGANTAMVQVCADLDDPATREREVGALKEAMEEHDVSEAQVVTWDFEGSLDKGIRAIPAWRWTCG